jgi:class 3 adenylate cyclase/YHS domain-containing protein
MSPDRAVVVFADLVGFSALTDAHGDRDAVVVADRLLALTEASLHVGVEVVKTIGDAVMLRGDEIPSTLETVAQLVDAILTEPRYPSVRVGVHVGPIITRPGDLFGQTVNVAARLAAAAAVGQVVGSRAVAAGAGPRFVAHPLGPLTLHNIAEPVEAFAIRLVDAEIADAAVDPVCRMRLDPAESHASRTYHDHVYAFCSATCTARFDADPDRYAVEAFGRPDLAAPLED